MKTNHLYIIVFSLFSFSFCNGQTLEDYLNIAIANNSEIKERNLNLQLAKEKVNEVGNIDNINVFFGYFASTPETRVGAQITKLGVQQQLPWFGTFKAQKDVASAISDTEAYDIELSERDLLYQVKAAYYELYQKEMVTTILKDNKQILSTYHALALSAFENNRASMSDVIKIRVQENELHSKIFQNLNEINALSRNFNRLLQREINTPLVITSNLNVLDIMLTNSTVEKHPSLAKIEQLNTVYDTEYLLINKEKLPQIGFGLDYVMVEERSGLNISDSGKDIVMPNVSLSIPVFTKKYNSKLDQIQIQKEALISKKESQQKQLEIALEHSSLELDNAILSVVAAHKNKEETQLAINVDLKAYETGILDYDKILKLQLQKIIYQLREIEATKHAFIAKAKINYLTK